MTELPVDPSALALSAVKVTLLFCAAWLSLAFLRRSSPGTRHRVASVALVGGLLVPALAAMVPAWCVLPSPWTLERNGARAELLTTERPRSAAVSREDALVGALAEESSARTTLEGAAGHATLRWTSQSVVASIWAAIAAALLGSLALQIARTSRFVRRMLPLDDPRWNARLGELKLALGIRRDVGLRLAGSGEMPFTWGLLRPVVVLPAEARRWSDGRSRAVLGHELAHVARCDVPMILVARLTCALHWFNPLAWGLHRRQRLESEHACDRVALGLGMRAADYADHLLETASAAGRTHDLAPVMAARTQLEGRIMAILDCERHGIGARSAALAPLVLGLALLLPIASAGWSRPTPRAAPGQQSAASSDTTDFRRRLEQLNIDRGDLQAVFAYLNDESALTRGACVWALGTNDDPLVVDPLISALVDRDATVRQWAVRGFLVRRAGDDRAVQPLARTASDRDAGVREWVVRTIPHLAGRRAAKTIEERLEDEHAEVRQWAVRALTSTHDEVAPALMRARLRDADAEVREWTVRALGQLGAEGLSLDLVERLFDEDSEVREWAVRTLGDLGDPTAVQALIEHTTDEDPEIREWAIRGLGAFDDPRIVAPLILSGRDPEPEVREWAVRVLGDHGDPVAIGAVEERLADEDEEVREWARRVLARLRGQ